MLLCQETYKTHYNLSRTNSLPSLSWCRSMFHVSSSGLERKSADGIFGCLGYLTISTNIICCKT